MIFNNKNEEIVAEGFTAKEWIDLLKGDKQKDAARALNYFDGQQEKELIDVLNDPYRGRAEWKRKGITPRFRNLTKMIVEKSGLLFKEAAPVLEVFKQNEVTADEAPTQFVAEELAKLEWAEFANNLDQTVRLLKTALVLVQWDADDRQLTLDILHRGNCEVVINPATRKPRALIQRYSDEGDYAIWTLEERIFLKQSSDGAIQVTEREPNPYGVVPVAVFYDTNAPRTGFWVEQDKSIVNLNEMVNLHITDSEYSIKWSKLSTGITNMRPAGGQAASETIGSGADTDAVTVLGGPGEVVVLDSMGVESPFFKYEAPQIDLLSLDNVVNTWIQSCAADWSVKVHTTNQTAANSGFQLMVEEMSNLDLRKQRQRMFENSFKRFYRVVSRILNVAYGRNVLDEQAEMFAKFASPALPVDQAAQEEIWSKKISEGRATVIDYFMQVEGMSKEEALSKYEEIKAFKEAAAPVASPEPLIDHANSITEQQSNSQALSQ
ncbi:hypothetical protein WG922_07710 [Ramlibacter sp. AN1015]|uniref:hypothetical protein n=1 Tax=Ramlibacter sp. AN1015 TaxID=3133428 RepID=UPI0030C0B0A9